MAFLIILSLAFIIIASSEQYLRDSRLISRFCKIANQSIRSKLRATTLLSPPLQLLNQFQLIMMSSECIRRSGRERRAPKNRHLDDNLEIKKSQPKQKSKKKAITKTNNPPLSLIAKTNLSMEEVSLVSDILNIGAVVSTDSTDVSPTSITATANNNNFAQGAPSSSSHSTSINNRPTNVDILRGRGGGTNHHPGNKKFRDEARVFRNRYKDKATTRREKYELSLTLVKRARDYGGRFLERRNGDDKNWYLMSEGDVRKKASQGMFICVLCIC